MNEKRIYVEPTIEDIDLSATEGGGNPCEPVGGIPPCTAGGPVEIDGSPLS